MLCCVPLRCCDALVFELVIVVVVVYVFARCYDVFCMSLSCLFCACSLEYVVFVCCFGLLFFWLLFVIVCCVCF